MKKIIVLLLLCAHVCVAQNLVPNPSFEDTLNCGVAQFPSSGWFNPTLATPDYYTSIPGCGKNWTTLPINRSPRTGIAFGGLFGWDGAGQREYVEIKLNDTLTAGVKYDVSFYVVRSYDSYYATDKLGACFTNDSLLSNNYFNLQVIPQVYNTSGIIYDTSNWTLISGDFIAQGGERYLTIGNFYDNQNCGVDSTNGNFFAAYYYLEDVRVIADSLTGVEEENNCLSIVRISDKLLIKNRCNFLEGDKIGITCYDYAGRQVKVLSKALNNNETIVETDAMAINGIYILRIYNKRFSKTYKFKINKNWG